MRILIFDPFHGAAGIAAQAGRVLHTSNIYRIPQQEQLADKLAKPAHLPAASNRHGF